MHLFRVIATLAFFSILSLPSFAQTTGVNVMSALGETIRREMTSFQVIGTRDVIRVIDRTSGDEVLKVTEVGPLNVAITATIGNYPSMSREIRARLMDRIALFNFSSIVGTLELDERNGTVVMSHNLNPTAVSIKEMAHVAALCNAIAREQSRSIMLPTRSSLK